MAISSSVGRRVLLAGGFSIAIAAVPAVAFVASPAGAPAGPAVAACPAGESEDLYTDQCIPELVPNQPGGNYPTASNGGGTTSLSTPGDSSSLPEVQGIPCTGANTGQCIGLQEDQVPAVTPHSSISSSP
jgi:hypothetical protein